MSAIFGIRHTSDDELLKRLVQRLQHRGNAMVSHVARDMLLGALSHEQRPPLYYSDYRCIVLGDIDCYNCHAIAQQLAVEGIAVDADDHWGLLGAGWNQWRTGLFSRLNADFALAIYCEREEAFYLSRDAAGTRPLHYTFWSGGLAFASEYKALLALPGLPIEVERESLQYLQTRKLLPPGLTLLKSIRSVPAATWVRVMGESIEPPVTFWRPRTSVRAGSLEVHSSQIRDVFLATLKRRTENMDPLAVSLSGGVDSIAMVGALRHLYPTRRLLTFSAGDDGNDPELHRARRAAELFKTESYSFVFGAERMRTELPRMTWHLEDPIGRTETLLGFCLAAEMRKHCSAVLRGDGADGLFGGMPRHKALALAGKYPLLRSLLGDVYSYSQTGVEPSRRLGRTLVRAYFRDQIPPPPQILGAAAPQPLAPLAGGGPELLNQVLAEGFALSAPAMMTKLDRMHSAFQVRGISPFGDRDLVEAAHMVPSILKHDGKRDKRVWREAVRCFLPAETASWPKVPQRMRETRVYCDVLENVSRPLLLPERVRSRGLFDVGQVQTLLRRPKSGIWKPEHAMRLWTVVLTEIWATLFLDGRGAHPDRDDTCGVVCSPIELRAPVPDRVQPVSWGKGK